MVLPATVHARQGDFWQSVALGHRGGAGRLYRRGIPAGRAARFRAAMRKGALGAP